MADSGDRAAYEEARAKWEMAAVEYASTPAGGTALEKQLAAVAEQGDEHAAGMLDSILRRGAALRAANKEVASTIALAKSMSTLEATPDASDDPGQYAPAQDLNGNPFTDAERTAWTTLTQRAAAQNADHIARYGGDRHLGRTSRITTFVEADRLLADPDATADQLRSSAYEVFGSRGADTLLAHQALGRRFLEHPHADSRVWMSVSTCGDVNDALSHPRIPGEAVSAILERIQAGNQRKAVLNGFGDSHVVRMSDISAASWSNLRTRATQGDIHAAVACLRSPEQVHREDAVLTLAGTNYESASDQEISMITHATHYASQNGIMSPEVNATMRDSLTRYRNSLTGDDEATTYRRRTVTRALDQTQPPGERPV